jgi:hypothetical protein
MNPLTESPSKGKIIEWVSNCFANTNQSTHRPTEKEMLMLNLLMPTSEFHFKRLSSLLNHTELLEIVQKDVEVKKQQVIKRYMEMQILRKEQARIQQVLHEATTSWAQAAAEYRVGMENVKAAEERMELLKDDAVWVAKLQGHVEDLFGLTASEINLCGSPRRSAHPPLNCDQSPSPSQIQSPDLRPTQTSAQCSESPHLAALDRGRPLSGCSSSSGLLPCKVFNSGKTDCGKEKPCGSPHICLFCGGEHGVVFCHHYPNGVARTVCGQSNAWKVCKRKVNSCPFFHPTFTYNFK